VKLPDFSISIVQVLSHRRTGRNTGTRYFHRLLLIRVIDGKLKRGQGGKGHQENKASGKGNLEHYSFPVPGLRSPGTFQPQFIKPQGKNPFATGTLIVFFTPFLIRPEQFPRPDSYAGTLYTALLDKVPQHVHLTTVFFRGIADKRRGSKSLFTPPQGPFQTPVKYPRPLPQQFFLKVFVLPVRGYRASKGYQLDTPPNPVVVSCIIGL
jgi:hypothetical protein